MKTWVVKTKDGIEHEITADKWIIDEIGLNFILDKRIIALFPTIEWLKENDEIIVPKTIYAEKKS